MRVPAVGEKDPVFIAQAVRELASGATNSIVGPYALTPGVASTVIEAQLATPDSMIVFTPLTLHAAQATVWIASVTHGSFTVGHDVSAAVDRSFKFEIRRK